MKKARNHWWPTTKDGEQWWPVFGTRRKFARLGMWWARIFIVAAAIVILIQLLLEHHL